jgi:hypothetical protein
MEAGELAEEGGHDAAGGNALVQPLAGVPEPDRVEVGVCYKMNGGRHGCRLVLLTTENTEGTESGGSVFDKILFHDPVFSVVNLMVYFFNRISEFFRINRIAF